jgi:hypothetical protein
MSESVCVRVWRERGIVCVCVCVVWEIREEDHHHWNYDDEVEEGRRGEMNDRSWRVKKKSPYSSVQGQLEGNFQLEIDV